MRNSNGTFTLTQPIILPRVADAVAAYEGQGGHLTCPEPYGADLLANQPGLQQLRMIQFHLRFSRFGTIFHHLVNDDNRLFKERIFHLMLSLDIYNYKLQTETIFNGYFT